ncbi:MAG: hypothetical protein ACRCYS_15730, partial [Beijerinckiaceae bacterium]
IYLLNAKRDVLQGMENRFGAHITITPDDHLGIGKTYSLEKGEPVAEHVLRAKMAERQQLLQSIVEEEEPDLPLDEEFDPELAESEATESDAAGEDENEPREARENRDGDENGGRKRRRRRRRRGRGNEARNGEALDGDESSEGDEADEGDDDRDDGEPKDSDAGAEAADGDDDEQRDGKGARRRRGRRGGRRNRRDREDSENAHSDSNGETVTAVAKSDVEAANGAGNSDAPFVGQDIVALQTPDETAFGAQKYQPASPEEAGILPGETQLTATPHAPYQEEPASPADKVAPRAPVTSNPDAYRVNEAAPNAPKRGGWWAKAKDALTGK